jgi:hypothetical protein
MLKVFVKIPGVPRPHAVVGNQLFEDERFLVIAQDVIKRKILWENILYIEELPSSTTDAVAGSDAQPEPPTPPPPTRTQAPAYKLKKSYPVEIVSDTDKPQEKIALTVAFTGSMNKLFTIDGVDPALVAGSKWTPDLAQTIFTNPQIKMILGSFIIKECHVDGPNITVVTDVLKKDTAINEASAKVELLQKFSNAAAKFGSPRPSRTSMKLPTDFSMSNSPFDAPIPMSGAQDNMEVMNDSNGEEEVNSQEAPDR